MADTVTSTVTLPLGLRGINAFSTPEWWRAASATDSGSVRFCSVGDLGSAVALVPHRSATIGPPCVLMITKPLVDWLLDTASGATPADSIPVLAAWADAVLAWTAVAPVRMVITRVDPVSIPDLLAATAGHRPVVDSDDCSPGDAATTFRSVLSQRLQQRPALPGDLDGFWSRAAIDAVAVATHRPSPADAELRAASIDIRDRLISNGVDIHGPRTGLIWPEQPESDLALDVAAEAVLAVLLAALNDPAPAIDPPQDRKATAATRRDLQQRLQAAERDAGARRSSPRNIKRVRVRSLIKHLVLGRKGG